MMNITFLGAAGEVTGSCFMVETDAVRFLVDCGLFQGLESSQKNRQALHLNATKLDFVLLTHAHIDHSGLLPLLTARGFDGPIYATRATCDLLEVMLLDSAHIQEKEAERAREWQRRGETLRDPASVNPIYTVAQARDCLRKLEGVGYERDIRPHATVRVKFRDAGHILGSSILEVWIETEGTTRKLVFSGDLGQPGHPLVNDPTPVEHADYLVVESTYGNRLHKPMKETTEELVEAVNETLERRRGNIVIPAFAVGRTQDLLFILSDLAADGRLVAKPRIFVDSPMAKAATEITMKHHRLLDEEARSFVQHMQSGRRTPLPVTFTESVEDSKAINRVSGGAIIIAASGMCEAGRIKHHLRNNLPRDENSVIFVGFQAQGTLGRRLVDGAQSVRIMGEEVPVRARRHTIGGLSAHADQAALMGWLGRFRAPPRQCFVVHGEAETAELFAGKIRQDLRWDAQVPAPGKKYLLA
jgi:metallo-beta-lactamase family protein